MAQNDKLTASLVVISEFPRVERGPGLSREVCSSSGGRFRRCRFFGKSSRVTPWCGRRKPAPTKKCHFPYSNGGVRSKIRFLQNFNLGSPLDFRGSALAGTLKVARNAAGKLPDTPADTPGGRRPPPPGVSAGVAWNLPGRVSSHFEAPGESTPPKIQGTPQYYL